MKILLVQTANKNLGDSVLADNNAWLIQEIMGDQAEVFRYSIVTEDISQVKYVDAVIFAGGILKITNEKFFSYIPNLIEEANRLGIPVFMSAIGCEYCDPESPFTKRLKKAVNLPCVKGVSIRDDIDTFRNTLLTNKNIRVKPVTDPAVWSSKCYGVFRQDTSDVIGLGITREFLFADYGHSEMTREKQIAFWTGVVTELEKRGYPWTIFTNGDRYDELFAEEILGIIGHGTKLPCPVDSDEMVQDIAGFRGVIAGRMHSNIVSYALGIPSIGFVWNQKLRFWSKKIGHPERFMEVEDMSPVLAVDKLEKALKERNKMPGWRLQHPVKKELSYFLKHHVNLRKAVTENFDYAEGILAPALGGIQYRYKNTNSIYAFREALSGGYRNFCAHLRLTSDGRMVLVQAWDRSTLDSLEKPADSPKPLSYEEFMGAKYYQRFSTVDLPGFLEELSGTQEKTKIVLSVGKPEDETFEEMLRQLRDGMKKYKLSESDFFLRIENIEQLESYTNSDYGMIPIYFLTNPKLEGEERMQNLIDRMQTVKGLGVETICITPKLDQVEVMDEIKKAGFRFYIDSYTSVGKVIRALHHGAWLAGSRYYSVNYLEKLTK